MFGVSKERKALVNSAGAVIKGFQASALESGSESADRDAAYMTCAFMHYAFTLFLKRGSIKSSDIFPIMNAYASQIRQIAPDYGLPVTYIEDTMTMVGNALVATGGDPFDWVQNYYEQIQDRVGIDEGSFLGGLFRETTALRGD